MRSSLALPHKKGPGGGKGEGGGGGGVILLPTNCDATVALECQGPLRNEV